MPQAGAQAWWADVEHLREAAERRQHQETPSLHVVRSREREDQAPRKARRTVEITGRTVPAPSVPRLVEIERRRPPRSAVERVGPRPDRIAMWAPLLGFMLLVVAIISSH
jgi:hypothetical protein